MDHHSDGAGNLGQVRYFDQHEPVAATKEIHVSMSSVKCQ